jgi:2,5-diamino-6-(ribosylamino)-4(3H)-pyrimidinone 5'-phosphate reductase
MTHYLRSRHDAICIGVGTALADDPGLNCRIAGACLSEQPRPIVIDPHARWHMSEHTKVLEVARNRHGLAPFIITGVSDPPADTRSLLERHGGKFIVLSGKEDVANDGHYSRSPAGGTTGTRFEWRDILSALQKEGLRSVMIEGGAHIINSLLEPACRDLVDSVIVTIAPTWLGQGGVVVSPNRALGHNGTPVPAARLADVSWHPLGEDVVLCGRISGSIE